MSQTTDHPAPDPAATRRWRDTPQGYGLISRATHWIFGLAILAMLATGFGAEILPLPRESMRALMGWHKAMGVIVLIAAVWRVSWRLWQGFPDPVTQGWQDKAARLTHLALLALALAMPVSGLLTSLSEDRAVDVFGLFTIPAIGSVHWLEEAMEGMHSAGALALTLLIVLHVGAALNHRYIDGDSALGRMTGG